MSFLLQESKARSNNKSSGRSGISIRNSTNSNPLVWIAVDDNSRIFPGFNRGDRELSQQQMSGSRTMLQRHKRRIVETSKLKKKQHRQEEQQTSNTLARTAVDDDSRMGFNRGNRKLSQQQMSGNQIMLQRQKRRIVATSKLQKKKHRQEERQIQQRQENSAKQEHENLGDYTMERVMEDLHILEQQQREAQRKLVSAQTTKQKRLDQMRQLHTLLENKNFSNGTLRAKLQQSRDFLSIATREIGNRKLATNRLQDGIADFECKLKRGVQSAKMIQVCSAKIDSFLILIEHMITSISRLRVERRQISKELRHAYEQSEKKDLELRFVIQDVHKSARRCGDEKASLRNEIIKLDKDKIVAQNAEQMTELQIQGAQEKLRIETDRVASFKRTLFSEIEEATKQRETISFEIKAGSTILETLKHRVQGYQEKVIECSKLEGYPRAKDISPAFDQNIFRGDIERIEEETKRDEDGLLALEKSIEDTEMALSVSNKKTLENDKETSLLLSAAKSLAEEEGKRGKNASDFQVSLERARAEVAKLEERFREMEATREFEVQEKLKAVADYDVDTRQQTKAVEDLKLKMKLEETSLKTKIRLFEDTEKLLLLKDLKGAKDESMSEEKKYHELVNLSGEALIESKLQADYKHKFDGETTKWEAKSESMISRCKEYFQNFPCLQNVDYEFVTDMDRDQQIDTALTDLENECTARKVAAKAIKKKRDFVRKERFTNVETKSEKPKGKTESQGRLKRRECRKESNSRVADAKVQPKDADAMEFTGGFDDSFISSSRNKTVQRRQRRRKKGSEFFNPRKEDDGTDNDLTPTNPRRLISSFLSQSSGQRVRWADGDIGGSTDCNGLGDSIKGDLDPHSKEIFDTNKPRTKTSRIASAKDDKSQNSENNIDSLETKKHSSIVDSKFLRGRQRSRSHNKSLQKKSVKRGRSKERHLEASEVSFPDATSLKTTDRVFTGKKGNRSSRVLTESDTTRTSVSRGRDGSSSAIREGKSSGLALLSEDSKDISGRPKSGSRNTYIESREKIRRKINQEDTNISSSKVVNAVRRRHKITRDVKKMHTRKLEGTMSRIEYDDKGFDFDVVLSDEKKVEKRSASDMSQKIKEKENQRGENTDLSNDGAPLRGQVRKKKSSISSNRDIGKGKAASKEKRHHSSEADPNLSSLRVATNDSKIYRPKSSIKRGVLGQSQRKNDARNSIGKCGSPRRHSAVKESTDKARETSNNGICENPSVQDVVEVSREKTDGKSNRSTQSTTKGYDRKALVAAGSKVRKKSSGRGAGKRLSGRVRELPSNCIRENKSAQGKGTASLGFSNARTLSSSQGNGTKKRKIKGDTVSLSSSNNVSVSSSRTTVTARRRKKRNSGLPQKSTATNVRDESYNFNFQ